MARHSHIRAERLQPSGHGRKVPLLPRSGGYSPASWSEESPTLDSPEPDSASRDPRLKRKPVTPTTAARVPKRKQDVHLLVHQILSEHSYCKGKGENEPQEESRRQLRARKGVVTVSSFLSHVGRRDRVRRHPLTVKSVHSVKKRDPKPEPVKECSARKDNLKVELSVTELEVIAASLQNKPFPQCSKHFEELKLYCVTCGEFVCKKCATEGHQGHDYGKLKMTDGEKSLPQKVDPVQPKMCSTKPESELDHEGSPLVLNGSVEPRSKVDEALTEVKEDQVSGLPRSEAKEEPELVKEAKEDVEEKESGIELHGFELDLDDDDFSSSDEMGCSGQEDQSYIISLPSNFSHVESRPGKPVLGVSALEKGRRPSSVAMEGPGGLASFRKQAHQIITRGGPSSQWSITNYDPNKNLIRFSKVDVSRTGGQLSSEAFNGQLVPNRLALYASNSSPSGSSLTDMSCDVSPRLSRGGKDTPESGGEWDMETRSLSSLDSCSSAPPCPGAEEKVGRGGIVRRKWKRKQWESMQMSTRRTRAAMRLATDDMANEAAMPERKRRRRGARGGSTHYKEFRAEVLTTRSRAETATMKRRLEMEKDMERHERERILTARPGDLEEWVPSPTSTEENMDDMSSEALSSYSLTSSSLLSSKDQDGSSIQSSSIRSGSIRSSLHDEFSPDVIARCKKISTSRSSGDTPLHKICRTGKQEMVRYLILVENAPVNVQDNAGWTPLHEACCNNHLDIASLLLKAGADANMSATDGTRPIHDAIESGNLDMVKLLLSNSADPLAELGEKTPLEFALANHQMEIHAFLESVIKEKLKSRSQKTTPSSSPCRTVQKKPTRSAKKDVLFKEAGDSQVAIPVDGYEEGGVYCGEELSYPLFYVNPIIELSDCPFLPTYNFKLSSGTNPRCHNFHLVSDILDCLEITKEALLHKCDGVVPLEIPVGKAIEQMDSSYHKLPDKLMHLAPNKKLQFLPLCSQLRQLLDIEVENLED